jgi:uncharacterized protein YlzI (FlbEa/FlbD family)
MTNKASSTAFVKVTEMVGSSSLTTWLNCAHVIAIVEQNGQTFITMSDGKSRTVKEPGGKIAAKANSGGEQQSSRK